ncbi:MAG: 7-carboxy-7-deazaguanine synthase [Oceanospirillaceae bacterium]|jgi:7-carboxy-7-deazaguanine synthase (Cx14CxxC type)|nr:7-carboxy-7-deazaguanine synthase [Oceanospirillaceae bacterium]
MYSVKEVFYTLQGEGAQAGRAAVFCRFAGCNLWSGREQDRAAAVCRFCDTDFVGVDGQNGGKFATAEELATHIASFWPGGGKPYVVCTGGEPALQLDEALVTALHAIGFEIAIETNGTQALAEGIDWVCVSPKGAAELRVRSGNELKLVFPQVEIQASPAALSELSFDHFYLQPLDDPSQVENMKACVRYCMQNPQWKISLQTHKILDID